MAYVYNDTIWFGDGILNGNLRCNDGGDDDDDDDGDGDGGGAGGDFRYCNGSSVTLRRGTLAMPWAISIILYVIWKSNAFLAF